MSIRRRIEVQKDKKRDIIMIPTIEDVGRIAAVSETAGHLNWEVFTPAGVSDSTGTSVESTVDGFAHITATIGPISTLGEGYRLEQDWRIDGEADDDRTYTIQVFFDVVTQEWTTELTLETLKTMLPPVGLRLTKHGLYFATAKTAEQMAAIYISDAMDHFDNILRQVITSSRIEARASLLPDPARFDNVLGKIAIALIYRADQDFDNYVQWINFAMSAFEKVKLIGYDSDENFIADDEILAPDRAKFFGLEFGMKGIL